MENKCSLLKRNFRFRKFDGQILLAAEWKERKKYVETLVALRDQVFDEEGEYFFIPPQKSESLVKDDSFCKIYDVGVMFQVKKIPMLKEEIKVIESFSPASATGQEEFSPLAAINDLQESHDETIILFELSQKDNICFLRIANRKKRKRLFGFLKIKCPGFAIENDDENKIITVSASKEERYYNFYNLVIDMAMTVLSRPKRQKSLLFFYKTQRKRLFSGKMEIAIK